MSATRHEFDLTVTGIHRVGDQSSGPARAMVRADESGHDISRHMDESRHFLALCASGRARCSIQGRPYSIGPGELLLLPTRSPGEGRGEREASAPCFSAEFGLSFANEWSEREFHRLGPVVKCPNPFEPSALFRELYRAWNVGNAGYLVQGRAVLLKLLYLFIRGNSWSAIRDPHYDTIGKLLNLMAAGGQGTFTVRQFAELAGLSPSYLRLLFKRATGMTVVQYQQHVKISKARDLLLSGECNVTEASRRAGFQDIYYFSKLFKRRGGVKPSYYMNR